MLRTYVYTITGDVELGRAYKHRKCRQGKIRHKFWNRPNDRVRDKRLRRARAKRMLM